MRQGQERQGGGGKSKKRVPNKDSLFYHHHPNFYDFFPRAIAPILVIIPLTILDAPKNIFRIAKIMARAWPMGFMSRFCIGPVPQAVV